METLPAVTFHDLVGRLHRPARTPRGPNLVIPGPIHPFVPQTASCDRVPDNLTPLDSDVILLTAPAAVGKSTFARALSNKCAIPFLDLAKVRVATHSLRGIISAEMGSDGPHELQHGKLCVIVDALDEARLLSGEKNFEEFLRTSFQFLLEDASAPRGKGAKLLLFGRPAAIEIASIILELEAPDLPVSKRASINNIYNSTLAVVG